MWHLPLWMDFPFYFPPPTFAWYPLLSKFLLFLPLLQQSHLPMFCCKFTCLKRNFISLRKDKKDCAIFGKNHRTLKKKFVHKNIAYKHKETQMGAHLGAKMCFKSPAHFEFIFFIKSIFYFIIWISNVSTYSIAFRSMAARNI